MNFRPRTWFRVSILSLASASLLSVLLTGCGMGTAASPPSTALLVSGEVHGGAPPVIGSTVTLYETQSQVSGSTYGSAGKVLGTGITDNKGYFAISTGYVCDSNEYVYLTATGGNPGGGTNNQLVMMAALGSCSNFSTTAMQNVARIYLSELSTAAAAYALGNFISITDAGDGLQTIGVGAPITNATATPACSNPGASLSCNANGLGHAFANAANLVDAVHFDGSYPSGLAYSVSPSNSNSEVPQALLDLIGNIEQSCVNSTGGTTAATTCGKLFMAATTPGGNVPTNTLGAVMNIAKYPTQNVTTLTNLATPLASVFLPALATTTDFTVSVVYGAVTSLGYPYSLTLDIADNVYLSIPAGVSSGPVSITSFGSNGNLRYVSAALASTTSCTAALPCPIASDTAATPNLWLINGTSSSSVRKIVASTGALAASTSLPSTYFFGVAVDKSNNVFVSLPVTGGAGINGVYELAGGAGTLTPAGTNPNSDIPGAIAINSIGGIWTADKYAASPSVTNYFGATNSTTPLAANAQTVDSVSGDGGLFGIAIDSGDNAWTNNIKKLFKVSADNTTIPVAMSIATTATTPIVASSARYSALDGVGNVFMPDNSNNYVWQYNLAANQFFNLNPCYVSGSGTPTCNASSTTTPNSGARIAQVDSTGSIWVVSSTNGHLVQIIGTGAPTWPQLSYLKPGVKP